MNDLQISEREFEKRKDRLLEIARADGYDAIVLFNAANIQYISGFYYYATERPVALVISPQQTEVVVPRLDKDLAERTGKNIDEVHHYFDYPQSNPMQHLAEVCSTLGIEERRIAVDSDGSAGKYGYRGPKLSEVIPGTVSVEDYVTVMREQKSDAEIELIREASVWANLGHRILQDNLEPGHRPIELSKRVEMKATGQMLDALGTGYEMTTRGSPITCKFTTGEVTYETHSIDQTNTIQAGVNVMTVVTANVGGYVTELERTLFMGEPSEEQSHYFSLVREAQSLVFGLLEPGVAYETIENVVVEHFKEHGVNEHNHRHIGHSMGLEKHERPYLDRGYEGTLSAGEIYSVEPALFVPEVGGFRQSDTVAITPDGAELLTYYPRDIEDLIVDG